MFAYRRRLLPGNHHHARAKEHANGSGRHAGHVRDDFHCLVRFEHVERRTVLTGIRAMFLRQPCGQIVEQLAHVVGNVRRLGRGNERKLRHFWSVSTQRVNH
jgi:hypothetical protein